MPEPKCFTKIARSITSKTTHPIIRVLKFGNGSKKTRNGLKFTACPHTAQNSMLQSLCGNTQGSKALTISASKMRSKFVKHCTRYLKKYRVDRQKSKGIFVLFYEQHVLLFMRIYISSSIKHKSYFNLVSEKIESLEFTKSGCGLTGSLSSSNTPSKFGFSRHISIGT